MVAEAQIQDDLQVGPLDRHMDMGRDTSPVADPALVCVLWLLQSRSCSAGDGAELTSVIERAACAIISLTANFYLLQHEIQVQSGQAPRALVRR